MPCTVVVGGQYGSEGKGKVVALVAALAEEPWVVRCGGPNSGHTTNVHGKEVVLRQLPAAAGHPNSMLFLSAGCAVSEEIVLMELDLCGLSRDQVVIDPRAVLVLQSDIDAEQTLAESISSTASGTGSALSRRLLRQCGLRLVGDSQILRERTRVESVAPLLHEHVDQGGRVIIEGTQGFGISLLHGPFFPHVTSRDTTAAGFVMEAGMSPRQVDEIVLVIRTFPIRVGGESGPLPHEISWEEIQRISRSPQVFVEYTSVTHRVRRVGRFDWDLVKLACRHNRPTALAVMGLDRLNYANSALGDVEDLTPDARVFLDELQRQFCVPVHWLGTGFDTFDAIHVEAPSPESLCHA